MKNWQLIAFGIVLGLLSSALIILVISRPTGDPIKILPAPSPMPLIVDVSGEVMNPGVYTLPPNARVVEAITAAGGLLKSANTAQLNLAARISDGDKIWVPALSQASENPTSAVRGSSFLININTASAKEIESLPGIGEVKANQIVTYRNEHGLFMSIEDLLNVPGIGSELLDTIRPLITLSD